MTMKSVVLILFVVFLRPAAHAVSYDNDDFLIASLETGTVEVFDHDWTYKGHLIDGLHRPGDLAFDQEGRLMILSQGDDEVDGHITTVDREGNVLPAGTFGHRLLRAAGSFAVDADGSLVVAVMALDGKIDPNDAGVYRFSRRGEQVERLAAGDVFGVAIASDGKIIASVHREPQLIVVKTQPEIAVELVRFIGGHARPGRIFYAPSTDKLFMAENGIRMLYELTTQPELSRQLPVVQKVRLQDLNIGPGGNLIALTEVGSIYEWKLDGTFVQARRHICRGYGLLWAGSLAEPSGESGIMPN